MDRVKKANKKIEQVLQKQLDLLYATVVLVLWNDYGWRRLRIDRFFKKTQEVWDDCAEAGIEDSMLSLLEKETGIEITMPGMKSYHEYAYLDNAAWDKKPPTEMQVLYIRQQQQKWLPAMLVASMCLALYRKEGWGPVRIARFVGYYEKLRDIYGNNIKALYEVVESETKYNRQEISRMKK